MANGSLIGKSVILVSALVGGLVGVLELSDRFMIAETAAEGDAQPVAVAKPTPETNPQSDDPVLDPKPEVLQPALPSEPATLEIAGSPIEQEIWRRVANELTRASCQDVDVAKVQVAARVVPKSDTSHGFEGHTLDGAVELRVHDVTERMRLLGSGKGPSGAAAAVDMALRGFDDEFRSTEFYKENCTGE